MSLHVHVTAAELQLGCVQLVIRQSSLAGMKTLARHLFNLLMSGCLEVCTHITVGQNDSFLECH